MADVAAREGTESFKGIKLEDIDDPRAQRYIHNLRVAVQRVQSKADAEVKAVTSRLDEERSLLAKQRSELAQNQAELAAVFQNPTVQAAMQVPDQAPTDPWSEEGIAHRVKQHTATVLQEVFGAISQGSEEMQAQAKELAAERSRAKEAKQAQAFIESKPDFADLHGDIKQLFDRSQLSLEECYDLVKAKRMASSGTAVAQARVEAQSVLSPGRRPPPATPPKTKSGSALYEWMQRHPEAAQELMAEQEGQRNGYA